jgi:aminoglycoside phosphotransferase (APT) family kinase protein
VPDFSQRDPAVVSDTLSRWLATKGQPDVEVFDVQAPASNGYSNETILCGTRAPGGDERRLVVRVAPSKHLLFLDAQFSKQYRVMRTLSDGGSSVLLPPLGEYEEDTQYFGVPFFTMEHVDGRVPGEPAYMPDSWVITATTAEQERMWWSGIEAMASVHKTDWRALGLEWLGDPARGQPGLSQQLSYYRDFLDWATKGAVVPVIESTWQWLVAHRPPEDGDVVISWGDSRIGNIIWDDFTPAAVIDWEMSTLAQPEMDLGWWLYFDRQFAEGLDLPRPAGFGSREDTIDRYAELMGRPMRDIFFYEVFAGFRFSVIMYRLFDLLFGRDLMDVEMESDMATNNIATQLVAKMLGLDPPT